MLTCRRIGHGCWHISILTRGCMDFIRKYGFYITRNAGSNQSLTSLLSPTEDCDDVFYPDTRSPMRCRQMASKMAGPFTKRPLAFSKSVPPTSCRMSMRLDSLQTKIDTLYVEMMAVRRLDQEIAKELLRIYTEIKIMKLKRSCLQHQELLEEAAYEAELADEVPVMCDAAPPKSMSRMLLSRGVTRMNISSRRFSCS